MFEIIIPAANPLQKGAKPPQQLQPPHDYQEQQAAVRDTAIRGQVTNLPDSDEIIAQIYAGTFQGAALMPVCEQYQDILGPACWVCSSEQTAEAKRQENAYLSFSISDFKLLIDLSYDYEELRCWITAKRVYGGRLQSCAEGEF